MIQKLYHAGFTLVELMISLAIFAILTAVLVANYGKFNQGILLTNLAYDVALTLRTAQSYGLNVKSRTNFASEYLFPYGVHFDVTSGKNTSVIFFSDTNSNNGNTVKPFGDGNYQEGEAISTYTIKRGSKVLKICIDNANNCNANVLDVTFVRPNPDAFMKYGNGQGNANQIANYAEIVLAASDGTTKKVIVRSTGQITVSN